jgi:hypothetical protein
MSTLIDNYPWLLAALEIVLPIALVAYIAWCVRPRARHEGSGPSAHGPRPSDGPPNKPKRERR